MPFRHNGKLQLGLHFLEIVLANIWSFQLEMNIPNLALRNRYRSGRWPTILTWTTSKPFRVDGHMLFGVRPIAIKHVGSRKFLQRRADRT
jgi:hypothetical protein